MPKVVEVPGVGNVEFPDSMNDEQVSAAIRAQVAKPADMGADKPGAFSRFFSSLASQLNPIPALQEWLNKPTENAKAGDALKVLDDIHKRAAALPENKGKPVNQWKTPELTPTENVLVEKGMNANLASHEGQHPLMAPAVAATGQAMQGDLAGAAGTIAGGYVAPAIAGEAAPPIARAVARGVEKAGGATALGMMKSALKPGVADAPTLADIREQAGTALKAEIPVTEAGHSKLVDLIQDYAKKAKAVVDARTAAGATVDPQAVASRLNDVNTVSALPEKATAAVNKAREAFLARKGVRPAEPPQPTGVLDASGQPVMRPGAPANPGNPIPFDVAYAEKQGSYRNAKNAYGELSEAQVESEKNLARGYKEEMDAQAPELKLLTEGEAKFIGLEPTLARAVRRAGNADVADMKGATQAGAGALAAGPAGAALGFGARVLDFPGIKSKLAIAINKASQRTGTPLSLAASHAKAAAILSRIAASSQTQPTDTGAGQ